VGSYFVENMGLRRSVVVEVASDFVACSLRWKLGGSLRFGWEVVGDNSSRRHQFLVGQNRLLHFEGHHFVEGSPLEGTRAEKNLLGWEAVGGSLRFGWEAVGDSLSLLPEGSSLAGMACLLSRLEDSEIQRADVESEGKKNLEYNLVLLQQNILE